LSVIRVRPDEARSSSIVPSAVVSVAGVTA
jgi:hypothetical protein